MAELIVKAGRGKAHHSAPKVDLTPMVDLGFLLITFFMFTAALNDPRHLELNMPSPQQGAQVQVYPEESTLTILPSAGHKCYYYFGELKPEQQLSSAACKDMRSIITAFTSRVRNLPAKYSRQAHIPHVILKPMQTSTYTDFVAMVDEMLIAKINYYVVMDPTQAEIELAKK